MISFVLMRRNKEIEIALRVELLKGSLRSNDMPVLLQCGAKD